VLAFRKVTGMRRTSAADRRVMSRLARGGGYFRARYPRHGKHIEADLSRQVMVLMRGARRAHLPRQHGRAVDADDPRELPLLPRAAGLQRQGDVLLQVLQRQLRDPRLQVVPTYPASHGCLRTPIPDARSIYDWFRMGDRIDIYP
jgi:hypothetical protein